MTVEEIEKIFPVLDGRYMRKIECAQNIEEEDAKIARVHDEMTAVKIEVAKMSTRLGILIAILSAIAVPAISLCVKLLFGG